MVRHVGVRHNTDGLASEITIILRRHLLQKVVFGVFKELECQRAVVVLHDAVIIVQNCQIVICIDAEFVCKASVVNVVYEGSKQQREEIEVCDKRPCPTNDSQQG